MIVAEIIQKGLTISSSTSDIPYQYSGNIQMQFIKDEGYDNFSVIGFYRTNYFEKTQLLEIASAVSGVTQIDYSVVEALPSTGKKGVIYLVANSGSGNNIYDEYIYINSKFEKLGSREMDLSSYAKKTDIPTKVSSLTNDSGYQTAAQVTSTINAKLVVMTDTELNAMWTEVFEA